MSTLNNSKPLEGGWRKRYRDHYNMLLNRPRWWGTGIVSIPKHRSYKEDNPSSTPSSQRSRSFSFRKFKPLIITWGRVVFSVDPSAQRMTPKKSFRDKKTVMVPGNHKDMHSLSLRNKNPISQKPMKETYKTGASRWLSSQRKQFRQTTRIIKSNEVLRTLNKMTAYSK